eukprot:scaffold117869_cov63-Phaeocystis_antarctica.AAC.4
MVDKAAESAALEAASYTSTRGSGWGGKPPSTRPEEAQKPSSGTAKRAFDHAALRSALPPLPPRPGLGAGRPTIMRGGGDRPRVPASAAAASIDLRRSSTKQ